jgi:hypothetical protein
VTKPFTPKRVDPEHQYQPTPRLRYEGDVHPITGDRVFRQDADGYKAAYRDIYRRNPNHPALKDKELWPHAI